MSVFLKFNAVGVAGFVLQLVLLTSLAGVGMPVTIATALAVEGAVLHNFAWHEWWTWRTCADSRRARRLARFHLSNGLLSIAGGALVTAWLVRAGVPLLAANMAATSACSLLNFVAAQMWVFRANDSRVAAGAAQLE